MAFEHIHHDSIRKSIGILGMNYGICPVIAYTGHIKSCYYILLHHIEITRYISNGAYRLGQQNKPVEIYALEPEQVQQIRELIESTTKAADYNQEILQIVEEQAAPFFAGQKSAEEVARLVQSKANIYVNEQR